MKNKPYKLSDPKCPACDFVADGNVSVSQHWDIHRIADTPMASLFTQHMSQEEFEESRRVVRAALAPGRMGSLVLRATEALEKANPGAKVKSFWDAGKAQKALDKSLAKGKRSFLRTASFQNDPALPEAFLLVEA